MLFYQMDFWSVWNLGIIGVGFAFIAASESETFNPELHEPVFWMFDLTSFL